MAKRESLGSFVRVVSANQKLRSQCEQVYNSTGNHLLLNTTECECTNNKSDHGATGSDREVNRVRMAF